MNTYLNSLPHKRAWQIAWPMILSNISVPLMGLADTAMLGHLDSPTYLGAVAVGANLLALFFWMFAFLRMGTTALTGQALGANDNGLISLQLLQGTALAIGLGLLLIALQSLILPFGLRLMAPDDGLSAYSLAYTQIRIYSAPAVFLTFVLIGWFVGLQNTRIPLLITVISNLINLLLDYIFIVKLGWAHKGAAFASLLAEYSALLIGVIAVFVCYKKYWRLLGHLSTLVKRIRFKSFLSLNTDLFIRTTILLIVFNFVIAQSARQGEIILAVNAIIMQLLLFVSFALDGYAHAAESMTAQAIGNKNVSRFYRVCIATALPAIFLSVVISLVFIIFPEALFSLFSDQIGIQTHAESYTIWLAILPIVSVACYMLDGIFIGASQTRLMLITMTISVVFVFFPCWWFLQHFHNHGLWAAFTAFNLSRSCLMGITFGLLSRNKNWFNKVVEINPN